jgi:hypothetical protein
MTVTKNNQYQQMGDYKIPNTMHSDSIPAIKKHITATSNNLYGKMSYDIGLSLFNKWRAQNIKEHQDDSITFISSTTGDNNIYLQALFCTLFLFYVNTKLHHSAVTYILTTFLIFCYVYTITYIYCFYYFFTDESIQESQSK